MYARGLLAFGFAGGLGCMCVLYLVVLVHATLTFHDYTASIAAKFTLLHSC